MLTYKTGCPFCPGNELMTERATLALVAKDGILKRLSDTEESQLKNGAFVYFRAVIHRSQLWNPWITRISRI